MGNTSVSGTLSVTGETTHTTSIFSATLLSNGSLPMFTGSTTMNGAVTVNYVFTVRVPYQSIAYPTTQNTFSMDADGSFYISAAAANKNYSLTISNYGGNNVMDIFNTGMVNYNRLQVQPMAHAWKLTMKICFSSSNNIVGYP